MEAELGDERQQFVESDPNTAPMNLLQAEPKPPLAVGLDGGLRARRTTRTRKEGWFEVIVGKSINASGEGKYVAFVHNDEKPKRRLYETLKSQGLEPGQPVSFFSDGEVTMRRLQLYLSPQSEHILDWFHVTMKLKVMNQMRKGMVGTEPVAWLAQWSRI